MVQGVSTTRVIQTALTARHRRHCPLVATLQHRRDRRGLTWRRGKRPRSLRATCGSTERCAKTSPSAPFKPEMRMSVGVELTQINLDAEGWERAKESVSFQTPPRSPCKEPRHHEVRCTRSVSVRMVGKSTKKVVDRTRTPETRTCKITRATQLK